MDGIKEILDALNTRIRSPIFGSIAITFIFTNWKPLFYLAFSDSTISAKFIYFDANTTIWSLIVIPLILGLILAIASPWIALFSSQVAEFPTSKRKLLQVDSVHKSLLRKQELEQTRKQTLAENEIHLIQAARRDEEIKKIQDPAIREELKTQIDQLRGDLNAVIDKTSNQNIPNNKMMDKRQKLEDRISVLGRQQKQYPANATLSKHK